MNKMMIAAAVAAPLASGAAGFGGYKLAQAPAATSDGMAEVISVLPVSKNVRVADTDRECSSVPVYYSDRVQTDNTDTGRNVAVGSVIGGVVGNQVFRGKSRDEGTLAGAALGGYLGYARAQSVNKPQTVQRVRYEQQCRTVKQYRTEQQPDGYDVTYRYNGQVFTSRMQTPPPARFPVAVQAAPAPVPAYGAS